MYEPNCRRLRYKVRNDVWQFLTLMVATLIGMQAATIKASDRQVGECTMRNEQEIKEAISAACLKSAVEMGDRIKTMSWFGRNVRRQASEKAAA